MQLQKNPKNSASDISKGLAERNFHVWPLFIHRKREPEGVHGQLEGFNRNLRPKAAVANNNHLAPNYSRGQVYYTSLNALSKSGPNRSSSSRENAKNPKFLLLEIP